MRRRGLVVVMGCAACLSRPVRARRNARDDLDTAADELDVLAHEATTLALSDRLAFVNIEINRRVGYCRDDATGRGDVDHWSTPCETLARGCGDCEDFAIAKHFLLEMSGVPAELHRLLYARYWPRGRPGRAVPHVTAVARAPRFTDPWVLDQVNPMLVALSSREDIEPLFSFDAHAVWCGVDTQPLPRGPLRAAGWLGVLERTRAQRH